MVLGPVAGKLTADGLGLAGLAYSNQLNSKLNELAKQ
jgi:hypothetical protein